MNINKTRAGLEVTLDNGKHYRVWRGLSSNGIGFVYERRNPNGRWAYVDPSRAYNVCSTLRGLYDKHVAI